MPQGWGRREVRLANSGGKGGVGRLHHLPHSLRQQAGEEEEMLVSDQTSVLVKAQPLPCVTLGKPLGL